MNLFVLGATGGTGRLVVDQAIAAGHTVTALVRSPEKLATSHPNLRVVTGSATNPESVARALRMHRVKKGDWVDVIGISKGKGFQGVVKRHHYAGGPESHGSMFHRHPGSMGASSYPSRVWKGKTLPGHMGAKRITVQRLKVIESRPDENLLFVRGAVPGAANGLIMVRKSKKG